MQLPKIDIDLIIQQKEYTYEDLTDLIVREYYQDILRLAAPIHQPNQLREKLVEEIFKHIVNNLPRYLPGTGLESGFIKMH